MCTVHQLDTLMTRIRELQIKRKSNHNTQRNVPQILHVVVAVVAVVDVVVAVIVACLSCSQWCLKKIANNMNSTYLD